MAPGYKSRLKSLCKLLGSDKKSMEFKQDFVRNYIDILRQNAQHLAMDLEATKREIYGRQATCQANPIEMELGVFPLPQDKENHLESIANQWPWELHGLVRVYEILATTKDPHEEALQNHDPLDSYEMVNGIISTPHQFITFLIKYVGSVQKDLKQLRKQLDKLKKQNKGETKDYFLPPSDKFLPPSDRFKPYKDYEP